MRHALAIAIATVVGTGVAAADGHGTLLIPVVGEHGVPVYCTHNLTPGVATPIDGGGYRITGVDHGRYAVRFELPHEKIDVLAVVPGEGEVIVPPVVARGRCRSIEVVERAPAADDDGPMWSLRYGRRYSAGAGVRKAAVNWAPRFRYRSPTKLW